MILYESKSKSCELSEVMNIKMLKNNLYGVVLVIGLFSNLCLGNSYFFKIQIGLITAIKFIISL